jgi:hypothetical protein
MEEILQPRGIELMRFSSIFIFRALLVSALSEDVLGKVV